jgi:membrane-associated protein
MGLFASLWDVAVHLDQHLAELSAQHGSWVYVPLFLVVFCETGLVVTPFLPADSLVFVAGAVWAAAGRDLRILAAVLGAAALFGDNVNYSLGRFLGPKVFRWENSRLFNQRALDYTHGFYARHGGKTVMIARFVPFMRTVAPFVAGVGRMQYPRFLAFSVVGAALWVVAVVGAGHFFGHVPFVRNNLSVLISAVVAVSVIPVLFQVVRARRAT